MSLPVPRALWVSLYVPRVLWVPQVPHGCRKTHGRPSVSPGVCGCPLASHRCPFISPGCCGSHRCLSGSPWVLRVPKVSLGVLWVPQDLWMSLDAISAPRCHLGAVGSIRVLWVPRVSLGCPSGSQRAPRGPRVPLTVPWVSLIVPLVPLSLRVSLCPTGAPWVLWGRQASLPIPRCLLGVPPSPPCPQCPPGWPRGSHRGGGNPPPPPIP